MFAPKMNILNKKVSRLINSFFLLITCFLFAQNDAEKNCGTTTSLESLEHIHGIKQQITKYEQEFLFKKSSTSKSVKVINSIPIKVHVIRSSKGSSTLSTSNLDGIISNINAIYADAFMEFFICDDVNYIDNDELYYFKKSNQSNLTETNNIPGIINIYFTDYIENSSNESICGYSDNTKGNDIIVIKTSCATNNSSLAHELGHFFSLMHTHGPNDTSTELVDGSNCDTDGDGLCDTPADPKLDNINVNNFCEYTGNLTDANGDSYNPDTGNIMSYSLKGCRKHFTPQQLARMYAYYQTTKNYFSCPSFNTDVSVNNSQTCEESLTVNFSNNASNATKWEWDIDSDGTIDYTTKNPTHIFEKGIYDVTLKVSNKARSFIKTFSNFIKVGTSTDYLDENFETIEMIGDHGWTAIDATNNGYNWSIGHGQTTSENTGPITNKNAYIYTEASNGELGDIAELISPCIDVINENTELSFSYHMFGNHIGELHVDLKTDSGYINDIIDPIYGSQQSSQNDDFIEKVIDLSSYTNQTVKVRFRAIRGNGWTGDIAIDDIFIRTIDASISSVVKIYPNPINDIINIKTNSLDEITNYSISNVFGQVFLSGTLTNNSINVAHLTSGTYLLTISNKYHTITKKIIK